MTKCRPSKWVPGAFLGAGLPLLAAVVYEANTLKMSDDIAGRASSALSADANTAWAKVESVRRDFTISGTAPSQEALDKAVAAVAGTEGVRTITQNIQIVEPVKLVAPTVESVTSSEATPTIKGTWHEGVAKTLAVSLDGKTYKIPENPELTTLAGEWTLKPAALAEGVYDVTVESSDGTTTLAGTAGKITIDLPDPVAPVKLALPTVLPFLGNVATPTFKGTWPELDAKTIQSNLQVKIAENTFVLGKNPELTSDGAGNWSLTPSTPLAEGEFEVMPGVVDVDGKWTKAEAPAKAIIDLTPPPAAEVVAPKAGAIWPFAITGKWAEAAGAGLVAVVAGRTYVVNRGAALSSDGQGNFTFQPSAKLTPGSYDIDFTTNDAAGNVTTQKLAAAIVIPEPAPAPALPAKPVVADAVPTAAWPYALTGTWDEQPGHSLSATVQGRTYVLGRGAALTSDGAGKFSFAPSAKFAPGSYDVDFTTNDKTGVPQTMTVKAGIVIPEPAPAPAMPAKPAVADAVPTAAWPYALTGTWDEKPGHSLSATVSGRTYVLGRGAALTSDGAGKFSFAPSAKFAPGSYDVDFTTNDKTGVPQTMTVKAGIVIPEPAPAPAMPAKPAVADAVPTAAWPYALTGTWDEKPGHSLSATVSGRTYVLGRGAALTSDGAGKYSFAPSAKFAPGSYDVDFTTNDLTGVPQTITVKAGIVVPEPPPPPPPPKKELPIPTVVSQLDLTGAPIIKGTWPHDTATGLSVAVNGRTYTLGTDANLRAKDGNWTLFPGAALKDGKYDVDAMAIAEGVTATDTTSQELEVAVTQPVAPTVMTMSGDVSPDHLSGAWDQAMAKTLKVSIPQVNVTAELGATNSPLVVDGDGKWKLNLAQPLPVGTYNVVAETTDQYGRVQIDATEGEVVVAAKGEAPAVRSIAPYDCVAVMNRIGNVFPIRFEYDLTDITKPFDLSVSQYAALLKDPRCASINIEVRGHADFKGSEIYNEDLSSRRGELIIEMLKEAGVDTARMTLIALGESQPLDPAISDEARMKNRRVEITAKP